MKNRKIKDHHQIKKRNQLRKAADLDVSDIEHDKKNRGQMQQ